MFFRKEHNSVIEHYEQIWRDYQAIYETFKLAKVLKQKQEEANQLRSHLQAISEKVMNFKTILCQAKGSIMLIHVDKVDKNVLC